MNVELMVGLYFFLLSLLSIILTYICIIIEETT